MLGSKGLFTVKASESELLFYRLPAIKEHVLIAIRLENLKDLRFKLVQY